MTTSGLCLSGDDALAQGRWVKLICGASNQDLASIADLCALYAVAGVHCVDVAADLAVVRAARLGLQWAYERTGRRPWLMVSVSDGADAHFRKAAFDPSLCPSDCPRPCEAVCPAEAIDAEAGVVRDRCYGCGRCLPACPLGLIAASDHRVGLQDLGPVLEQLRPDALEIHTAPGRLDDFQRTVDQVVAAAIPLRRLAVSCGLEGHGLNSEDLIRELWGRHQVLRRLALKPLWQLDGRPMSGDVGLGTARAALRLWQQVRTSAPPGPLQLAGGTNAATLELLDGLGIPRSQGPAGVAFGGRARALVQPLLQEAEVRQCSLRDWPEGWFQALELARSLVDPWLARGLTPQQQPESC